VAKLILHLVGAFAVGLLGIALLNLLQFIFNLI
jgi:uncharacterized membrane protein YuzA (DUF378 family)